MKKRTLSLALAALLILGLTSAALAATDASENLTQVSVVGEKGRTLYGYADQNGNIVIPMEYEILGDFSRGLVYARRDGKYGYLNAMGETIIPFVYDEAESFDEHGYAKVSKQLDPDALLSETDTWREIWLQLGDPEQDELLKTFWQQYNADNMGYGPMDYLVNVFIPQNDRYRETHYDYYDDYYYGYDCYGEWAYIEDELSYYSWRTEQLREALEPLRYERLYGVIDTSGRTVVPLKYNAIGEMLGGDFAVGRYDRDGNLKWGTSEGLPFPVMKDGKYGCFDRGGNEILAVKYSDTAFQKQVERLKDPDRRNFSLVPVLAGAAVVVVLAVVVIVVVAVVRKKKRAKAASALISTAPEVPPADPAAEAAKPCPACGHPNRPEACFCPRCGTALDEEK